MTSAIDSSEKQVIANKDTNKKICTNFNEEFPKRPIRFNIRKTTPLKQYAQNRVKQLF
jgi:hypothetical protein